MPNSRLEIMVDEFQVNFLFNRSIYRPMRTQMGDKLYSFTVMSSVVRLNYEM